MLTLPGYTTGDGEMDVSRKTITLSAGPQSHVLSCLKTVADDAEEVRTMNVIIVMLNAMMFLCLLPCVSLIRKVVSSCVSSLFPDFVRIEKKDSLLRSSLFKEVGS